MAEKCNLDERAVIERYEECETARIVAQEFGVSTETIYRILKRNDIQRTHRHPKESKSKWVSNCRSKFCPSLIAMLRTVLNMNTSDISKLMNCNLSTVSNVIARRGLQREKPIREKDVDIEAIEAEYLEGASIYELGEKYGVYHSTISKWMKKRGHVRGKGKGKARDKVDVEKRAEAKRIFEKYLADEYGDRFTCLEYTNRCEPYKLRCNKCGSEFTRWYEKRKSITCPLCYSRKLELIRAANGGKRFEPGGHRRRCRKYGRIYDPSVTREKLIKRDNNICQICGEVCDDNDKRWGHFGPLTPTIDHVIALNKGGNHVWDNVQLAHAICNIIKNDGELTKEVITHAKEQAIAHKCA